MVKKFYEGRGTSHVVALTDLIENARKNKYEIDPLFKGVEYICKITKNKETYEGQTSNNYEEAFASAFERARITYKNLKNCSLEVIARLPYTSKEAEGRVRSSPPRRDVDPSGSAQTSHYGARKVTDLA